MTTVFLIRHGDKYPIPPDPGLNTLGQSQAQKTAEFLSQFPIQTILASPLLRAQETAEYTSQALGITVQTEAKLRERINWGDDPALSREDFVELWRKGSHNREFSPSFGVSSRQAGENIADVIKQCADDQSTHIALFTHGGIIADFLRNILPDSSLEEIKVASGDGFDYEVEECSITTLTVSEHLTVESINSISHL